VRGHGPELRHFVFIGSEKTSKKPLNRRVGISIALGVQDHPGMHGLVDAQSAAGVDESTEDRLRALDRSYAASKVRDRYRVLRHPFRIGYPTRTQLARWKESGRGVESTAWLPWGVPFRIMLPDDVATSLRRNGFFEYELSRFYLKFLRSGMTFVDIGAHVGYFSLLASRSVGPRGRVLSFEPTPSTYGILAANAADHGNITAVNLACWSEPADITLYDYGPGFSGYNSVVRTRLPDWLRNGPSRYRHAIPAVRLDDHAREHRYVPDAVKIDVESAELQVLKGMHELLAGARPVVSLEVGDAVRGGPRSREALDHVLAYGYAALELQPGGGLARHEPKQDYGYDNLVLVPSERVGDFTG
jgi:FkbM family methyltransferase